MIVNYNGRSETTSGDKPAKPVKWTGTFSITDKAGDVLEIEWLSNTTPRMDYQGALNKALQVVNEMKARLFEKNKEPIRKVSFTLTCR
ncbi:hypothetical protein HZF02_32950 (plasmid) [Pseudomonas yamanorum]|nr:hypothetical protein HZF02_32950 [Pseudomonas yamanorum]